MLKAQMPSVDTKEKSGWSHTSSATFRNATRACSLTSTPERLRAAPTLPCGQTEPGLKQPEAPSIDKNWIFFPSLAQYLIRESQT